MPTSVDLLLKSINIPGEKKTLTPEEEVVLGTSIQNKNTSEEARREAINTLVIKNIYLVLKLVHKYKRTSFDFEDLVGYGILGLFTAARKYQPLKANRFASYARHWVKESVMKAIREYNSTPKIPVYLVKNLWKVTRIVTRREESTDEEVAKLAELSCEEVKYLRSLLFKTVQYNQDYTDICTDTPESEYICKERVTTFNKVLEEILTPEEWLVLKHSCELAGEMKMTFSDIESQFSIEHARKLKTSAMAKLCKENRLQDLYTEG